MICEWPLRKNGEIVSRSRYAFRWNTTQSVVLFLKKGDRVDTFENGHPKGSGEFAKRSNYNEVSIFLGFRMGPN